MGDYQRVARPSEKLPAAVQINLPVEFPADCNPRTEIQGEHVRLFIYIYICVCARACHCIHNMFCNSDIYIYISLYIHIFTAYICHWKGTTNQAMSWPNCIPCWLQSERAEPKLMRDEGGAFQLKLRNCGFICRDLFKSFYYGKS